MTDPKTSPSQFLMEASEAYDKRKLHQLELQKLKDENLRFSRELEKLRASIDKEKNGVIDRRRGDIEAEYEKQLRSLDNSIRELTEKRKKARDLGVKNRIKSETAELYSANEERTRELKRTISDSKLPAYSRSRLYYALFMPRSPREFLVAILCFAVVFILLPLILMLAIPGEGPLESILIYVAVIIIFGGIYIKTLHRTRLRDPEGVRKGRELVSQLNENDKHIRRMKRSIKRDKDDRLYDLSSYDDELTKLADQKKQVEDKRTEALASFDAVTRNVLSDEINEKHKSELEKLSIDVSDRSGRIATMEKELSEEDMALSQYAQFIGSENMDHEKLQTMLNLIRSGEAATVGEASEKIKKR